MSNKPKGKVKTLESVMKESLSKRGTISLNFTVRLKDAKGQYSHFKGSSVVVETQSADQAKAFAKTMRSEAIALARKFGFTIPGLVIVNEPAGEVAEG